MASRFYSALIFCCFGRVLGAEFLPQEAALKRTMIQQCNILEKVRPLQFFNESILVKAAFSPYSFRSIDELSQTFSVTGRMIFFWNHPCVRWDANSGQWAGVKFFTIKPAMLSWIPGVAIVRGAPDTISVTEAHKDTSALLFHSTGQVELSITTAMTVYCLLDFKKFPFDSQACRISFQPFHSIEKVQLKLAENQKSMDGMFIPPASVWKLSSTEFRYARVTWGNVSYDEVRYFFTFKRQPAAYIVNYFLASFCLIIINLAAFLIPPENSERTTFCITVVLAFGVMQASLLNYIPSSADVAYISIYVAVHSVIGFLCTFYALIICALPYDAFDEEVTICGTTMTKVRFADIIFVAVVTFLMIMFDGCLISLMIN